MFLSKDTLLNVNKVTLTEDIRSIFVGKYSCVSEALEKKMFLNSLLEREFGGPDSQT